MSAGLKGVGEIASPVMSGLTLAAVLWVGNSIQELQSGQVLLEYRVEVIEMILKEGQET